jgi:hypothetical protein
MPDLPEFEGVPASVKERLLKARRDPTEPEPPPVAKRSQAVRLGAPGKADIFRTYPIPNRGWFDVAVLIVRKGFDDSGGDSSRGSKRLYLVGD